MSLIRRGLFIALSLIAVSAYSGDTDPASREDCEQIPAPETPLSEVVPQCMAQRKPAETSVELVTEDLEVCRCLRERNALFPRSREVVSREPEERRQILANYASSMANNLGMDVLTRSTTNENAATAILGSGMGEIRFQQGRRPGATETDQQVRQATEQMKITPDLTRADEIPEQYRDRQCITYLEYSAQRELPYDNAFFTFLGSTTRFIASDWNMNSLRDAYNGTQNADVRRSIQARMVFLSRNPQYAALFAATTIEGISPEVLSARKEDLFRTIRTLAPPAGSTCQNTENQCWRDAQASAYRNFSEAAERFLLQDDVTDIVSAQTATNYFEAMGRMAQAAPDSLIPRTREGYSNFLQSAQQDIAFQCTGPTAEASCYERFATHCSRLEKLQSQAISSAGKTGEDIVSELNAAEVVHGLLNPQTNLSFMEFNDLVCRQQFQNASGERSNFFEFRNRTCAAPTPAADCSDRRALLARYLREYSRSSNIADDNVRAGLADALDRPNFVQLTQQQIETLNNIDLRPRELRAQFGGRMPTVSGTGQLIRPTGSTSRTAPVSGGDSTGSSVPSVPEVATTPSTGGRTQPQEERTFRPSEAARVDTDNDVRSVAPAREITRTRDRELPQNFFRAPALPSLPVFQPQGRPSEPAVTERRPASQDVPEESPIQPLITGGGQIQPQSTAVQSGASVSVSGATVRAEPRVELPRRRRRDRGSENIRSALLAKYENVSEDTGSAYQRELAERAPAPVTVDAEALAAVINDPAALAANEAVMSAVNASSDPVVKLSLTTGEDGTPVVVYAAKNNGQVTFSFTPPAEPTNTRLPASLGDNEMNVRLPDRSLYDQISARPETLSGYESVVRSAMSLPGDVIRLNVYVPGQEPVYVYVDKRGPRPVFTSTDQNIIRAYRP